MVKLINSAHHVVDGDRQGEEINKQRVIKGISLAPDGKIYAGSTVLADTVETEGLEEIPNSAIGHIAFVNKTPTIHLTGFHGCDGRKGALVLVRMSSGHLSGKNPTFVVEEGRDLILTDLVCYDNGYPEYHVLAWIPDGAALTVVARKKGYEDFRPGRIVAGGLEGIEIERH